MSAQAREHIIIDGEETYLSFAPGIPEHPKIKYIGFKKVNGIIQRNSGHRRGYTGTWEINGNRLYLVDVEGIYEMSGGPIFAEWVSDTLIIQQGELLCYEHSGFGGIYERELRITVVSGVVTESKTVEAMDDPIYKEHLEYVAEHGNMWD